MCIDMWQPYQKLNVVANIQKNIQIHLLEY